MENMINLLHQQVKDMNAGEAHTSFSEINGDKETTAVISVYNGQRPAHEVLSELYEWAESNHLTHVLEKIKQLEEVEFKE